MLAPSVRDAVGENVLSTDKANQLLHFFTKKRAEYVERDVDMLIGEATRLTVNQTRLMMNKWAALVDAEIASTSGDAEPADDSVIDNELFISETIDGMTILQGQFDAEVGETIRTAIDLARRLEMEHSMKLISPPITKKTKPIPTTTRPSIRNQSMNAALPNNAPTQSG